MAYQTSTNHYESSIYIVDDSGNSPYTTVQSALDAANTAGVEAIVFIRAGSYTEDLTLYDGIGIQGYTNFETVVTGVHTPPATGNVKISNLGLGSTTDIIYSAAAGTALIYLENCTFTCTDGYIGNLPNWAAGGELNISMCSDTSTVNGIFNNAGTAWLSIESSYIGVGTTKSITMDGSVSIYNSVIGCPINLSGVEDSIIDSGSLLLETVTVSGDVNLNIGNSRFSTGVDTSFITTSSVTTVLSNVAINTSNVAAIGGTGTVKLVSVSYEDSSASAATVTEDVTSTLRTGTIYSPTFDTDVDASGVTLSGTSLLADGTDADISINVTPKGAGVLATTELTLTTDLAVSYGGTGASTFTDGGLLVGAAANAIEALAVGGVGTILTGVAGANPTWTTATYPATAAIGTILIASAANTITTLAPDTAGFVLTDGGVGVAPSWQVNGVGTVTSVSGGTNINMTGTAADPIVNLDATITLTTVNATTFDTNVAAAGVTLAGTTLSADGTDADIDLTITAKGTGHVIIDDLNISGLTAGTVRSSATGDISSLADGTDGMLLISKTGDVPIWATLTDGNNITSTEGANSISIAVTGTTEHAVQIGSAAGALTSLAVGTDGQVLLGSSAADPIFATLASTDGTVTYTPGAGTLDLSASAVDVDQDNILYVGKHGDDANNGKTSSKAKLTIQAAVTAAAAGNTIIVYPGEYAETVTHTANNVTLIAQGKPNSCKITQADANVIDFVGYTGIQYKYFMISCTAATTAIWTITGVAGSCAFKECRLSMTTSTNVAAVAQAGVARVTGAGAITVILGKVYFYHTGDGGATAQKAAFSVANGGLISLAIIEDLTITNSGTALVSGVGIDTASTGNFEIHDCKITVTDPSSTIVTGLAYLGGTGTSSEFFRNDVHVVATNNTGYGFFSADTASNSRFFFNHIHVTDVAGASYSYLVGAGATVSAIFDDVVAADGATVTATGIFYEVKSPSDGDLKCSGPEIAGTRYLTVANTDNTATASNAAMNVSVGGTTSTGDPYTNYLVTGGGTYSMGIDNSVADDPFKITSGATPSAGTDLLTMSNAGVITLNNDLDVSEGGTGVSTLTDGGLLVGAAAAAIEALAVGGTGTILTGVGGANPAWTTATYPSTSSQGDLLYSSADNTIVALTKDANATRYLSNTGATNNPAWAQIDLTNGVTGVLPATNGGQLVWTEVTDATVNLAVNSAYIMNRGTLITATLPVTAAKGSIIKITGLGAGLFLIAQNALQSINFCSDTTTVGVGGSLAATQAYDGVELVCVVADTTFNITASVGNLTLV